MGEAQLDKETDCDLGNILAPGQEKKLNVSYSVKFPKDKKVVLK